MSEPVAMEATESFPGSNLGSHLLDSSDSFFDSDLPLLSGAENKW